MSYTRDIGDYRASTVEGLACRRLWGAVLLDQWNASFRSAPFGSHYGGNGESLRLQACRWFGSRDFYLVTRYAGLDPDAVFDRWRRVQALFHADGAPQNWLRQRVARLEARP